MLSNAGAQPRITQDGEGAPIELEVLPFASTAAWLRPVLLLVVGFALHRTWEELFFIGATPYFPDLGFNNYQAFLLAKGLALLACAGMARKVDATCGKRAVYALTGALLLASTACMLLTVGPYGSPVGLVLAGALLGGVGSGIFTAVWFEQCARLNSSIALLCFLAACLLAPLLITFSQNLQTAWLLAAGVAFPVLSLATTRSGLLALPAGELPTSYSVKSPTFWKTVVLLSFFTLAFAMGKPIMGNSVFSAGSHTAFGSLAVSILACISIAAQESRFDLVFMFRVVLPTTAVFALLLLTGIPFIQPIADNCLSASFKITEILAVLGLASLCYRYQASPVRLIGLAFGLKTLFCFFGGAVWDLFGMLGADSSGEWATLCFSVMIAAAVVLSMLLLPSRSSFKVVGEGLAADEDAAARAKELEYRCHMIAKDKSLTSREEEVFYLFAQDKSVRDVQEALFISKETVKTHRRNVYSKCGVSTREELLGLLE